MSNSNVSDNGELFKIKGSVTCKKPGVLVVKEDGETYTIHYNKSYTDIIRHCAVNDLIQCFVSEEWCTAQTSKDSRDSSSENESTESEECTLHLEGEPFITSVIDSEKHTIQAMIRAVRNKGKLEVPIKYLHEIYKHVLKKSPTTTVSEYLSIKANQYNRCQQNDVINSVIFGSKIMPHHVGTLLKGWYNTHDIRLLSLLKLSLDDIRKSLIRPDILYTRLVTNPLSVHSMPQDRALELAKIMDIIYNKIQLTAGIVIRKLSSRTVGNSSTYVKVESFCKTNHITQDVLQELLKFGCVIEDGKLYITEIRDIEESVADTFSTFMSAKIKSSTVKNTSTTACNYTSLGDGKILDEEQTKAVHIALNSNVSVITGAAGTGKTAIIKSLIALLKREGTVFACTSFTGKATARIEEMCGVDAMNMDTMIVRRNDFTGPAKFDHLIIDEFGMTCDELMYLFFCAFPGPYKITLVGDVNQLEPINFGGILGEIIRSNCIPVTRLKVIYRVVTEEGLVDRIVENSKRIAYWEDKPFDFVQGENFKVRSGNISDVIRVIKQHKKDKVPLTDFIVISPYTQPNPILNRAVQYIYNKRNPCVMKVGYNDWIYLDSYADKKTCTSKNTIFHVGDLIMTDKNDRKLGIFNGQEGVVIEVSMKGVTVQFRTKEVCFPLTSSGISANVSYISLCYSVTIHKMQGSQRKSIIYFLFECTGFVTKKVTYTAITRASSRVLIIGDPAAVNRSILNKGYPKHEHMCMRLQHKLPQDYAEKTEDEMAKELQARKVLLEARFREEYGDDDQDDYDDDY